MYGFLNKYVHGKELIKTKHVFDSPVSCSCKQQIHLAGSLGEPVISEVLILQRALLGYTPFGKACDPAASQDHKDITSIEWLLLNSFQENGNFSLFEVKIP